VKIRFILSKKASFLKLPKPENPKGVTIGKGKNYK